MKTRIPTLLVPLLLTACTGKADDSAAPQASGVVWAGWNHTWERLSHRVSAERAILNADGSAELGMVGGDWSTGADDIDFPNYRMHHSDVTAAGFAVAHGQSDMTIGPDGTLTVTETVDAPEVAALSNQIVVLRGLDILTDVEQSAEYGTEYDPSLGYCTNGFAMQVGAPSVSGDSISFDVTGTVRWGPAGPDDPLDRSDMNAAIPHAQTGMTVAWTVIGWDGSLSEATGSGTVDYPNGIYSDQPPLTESDLGLSLTGGTPGFPALRSVDLLVEVPEHPETGEYLRSYGAELGTAGGDPPVTVLTEGTNSSLVETATIRFTSSLDAVWIGLDDASGTVIPVTFEGSHEVGYTTVPAG
jgi:hypothetical protein